MNHDSRFAIFGSRLSTSPHATVMGEDIFGGMNFGGGIFASDPLRGQKDVTVDLRDLIPQFCGILMRWWNF